MLVLKRKLGESITIPEHSIQIDILRVKDGMVSLGIKAPNETIIWRKEIEPKPGEPVTRKPEEGL